MTIFIATFVFFALAMLTLAAGVLLSGKTIKGSCGGLANLDECPYCSGTCEREKLAKPATRKDRDTGMNA